MPLGGSLLPRSRTTGSGTHLSCLHAPRCSLLSAESLTLMLSAPSRDPPVARTLQWIRKFVERGGRDVTLDRLDGRGVRSRTRGRCSVDLPPADSGRVEAGGGCALYTMDGSARQSEDSRKRLAGWCTCSAQAEEEEQSRRAPSSGPEEALACVYYVLSLRLEPQHEGVLVVASLDQLWLALGEVGGRSAPLPNGHR